MDNSSNKSPVYLVNFENYLRPKIKSNLIHDKEPTEEKPTKQSSFELFCELSSIHGISMLSLSKTTPICERITWKIIIFSSVIFSALVLYYWTMINYETPTVTYIETMHYPGYILPFPAVTLCNLNRISRIKAEKLADKFVLTTNLTRAKILQLFEIPLYLKENIHEYPGDFKAFDDMLLLNNFTLAQFFENTQPKCEEELKRCMWKGRTVPCATIFEPVIVLRGRCCSFNNFAREENQTKRYNHLLKTNASPLRVSASGYETGLTVLIDPRPNDYLGGTLKFSGYRAIVADSYDYPEDNGNNEIIPLKHEAYVSVKTTLTFGTEYLGNMPLTKRGCIFDFEYKLKFFRQYSYWNCLAECLSGRVIPLCGCAPHNNVYPPGVKICGMQQFDCVIKENEAFQELVITADILGTKICNCMAECSYHKYRTIISTGALNRTFVKGTHRFSKNITTSNEILLHVFFGDLNTALFRIDAIESWQSIVGTVGGIAGMTMGINVVCLAEVVFFLCIRPLYMKYVKANHAN